MSFMIRLFAERITDLRSPSSGNSAMPGIVVTQLMRNLSAVLAATAM